MWKPHLLIIEHEPAIVYFLDHFFKQEGFSVTTVRNDWNGILAYRACHDDIDLVLLDVGMPGLDGPLTLRALQNINPEVKCCFMTVGSTSYTTKALIDLGAIRVFYKPISPTALVEQVRDIINSLREQSS